jgi:hypothetical protein
MMGRKIWLQMEFRPVFVGDRTGPTGPTGFILKSPSCRINFGGISQIHVGGCLELGNDPQQQQHVY